MLYEAGKVQCSKATYYDGLLTLQSALEGALEAAAEELRHEDEEDESPPGYNSDNEE